MNKVTNLIALLNMLYSRRSVSTKAIVSTFGVTERTAYRYIRTLSAADVPVYYDQRVGGYSVHRYGSYTIHDLTIVDSILLSIAMFRLIDEVDDAYSSEVERLKKKALAHLPSSFSKFWELCSNWMQRYPVSQTMSELITSLLVGTAVTENRKLRLALRCNGGSDTDLVFSRSSLSFEGEWVLKGKVSGNDQTIPLSSIRKVAVE